MSVFLLYVPPFQTGRDVYERMKMRTGSYVSRSKV